MNPFPTSLELSILKLLDDSGEMYGLQLLHASGKKIKRGTVYVTLGRLEEKGFIRRSRGISPTYGKRERPLYNVTEAGRRGLAAAELLSKPTKARL